MTFNEAVQAMLKGKKVRWTSIKGYAYIMLDGDGDVVDNTGKPFVFSKSDFTRDWETADTPSAGSLLKRYDEYYRLIKDTDGTYAIINAETYVERTKGILEEQLINELNCQNFSVVNSEEDTIKDGDLFKSARGHTVRVWKLSNGKYIAINSLLKGQTKQELSRFMQSNLLYKVTK